MIAPAVLERFKEAAGPGGWTGETAEIAPFVVELRGRWTGRTPLLLRPDNTRAVAALMQIAAASGTPVVPQGGNTGMCGGAVPDTSGEAVIINLSRMNGIRGIDAENRTMTVEAGCILQTVQQAAADKGLLFPLSLAAEGSCQIGGNIATNAGGTQVLRYGNAGDLVLGLEVVLADGTVWNGLRGLRKDNTGYDLKRLFIGSEGTLGIITAAVLRLFPAPRTIETALVGVDTAKDAVALFGQLNRTLEEHLTAFELMSSASVALAERHIDGVRNPLSGRPGWQLLIEVTSSRKDAGLGATLEKTLADAATDGLAADAVIAKNLTERRQLWRLRESIPEAQRREGASIKNDIAVPLSEIPRFLALADAAARKEIEGVRLVTFGHLGDGNLHYNLSQPVDMEADAFLARRDAINRRIDDIVVSLGGSFSAEHGIGVLKKAEMARLRGPLEIALMARIKKALDPANLMNPGKLLPEADEKGG